MLAPEVVPLRREAAGEAEANWVVKREKTVFQASRALAEYDTWPHSMGIPSVRPQGRGGGEGSPGPAGADCFLVCSEWLGLSTEHELASG